MKIRNTIVLGCEISKQGEGTNLLRWVHPAFADTKKKHTFASLASVQQHNMKQAKLHQGNSRPFA